MRTASNKDEGIIAGSRVSFCAQSRKDACRGKQIGVRNIYFNIYFEVYNYIYFALANFIGLPVNSGAIGM